VPAHDVVDEFDRVGARERLAAGQEEPRGTERDGLVDRLAHDWAGEAAAALRARRHQTVRAGEIAEIVDLDPELAQLVGPQVRRSPR
jgi:hypothetical protein